MLGPHSLAQWPALVGHTSLHSIRRAKVAMAFHKSAVLQIMVMLGPVQLESGDVQGANTMLASSLTLSKHLRDLPTQVRPGQTAILGRREARHLCCTGEACRAKT